MKSWLFISIAAIMAVLTTTAQSQSQSFNPNGVVSDQRFDPAKIGTNKTTNATYENPIMSVNAGDP